LHFHRNALTTTMQPSTFILALAVVALVPVPQCHAAPAVVEKIRHLVRRGWLSGVGTAAAKCTTCYNTGSSGGSSGESSSSEEEDDCFPGDALVQLEGFNLEQPVTAWHGVALATHNGLLGAKCTKRKRRNTAYQKPPETTKRQAPNK